MGIYLWELCQSSTGIVISYYACPELVHHPPGFIKTLQSKEQLAGMLCITLKREEDLQVIVHVTMDSNGSNK